MGFISLFLILFWPVLLLAAALAVILPFLGWALNLTAAVLCALNLALFLLLFYIRRRWKASGQMDRLYIDSFTGYKHFALRAAKILLTFGVIWEAFAALLFAALLIWRPWNGIL